jgi:hypothetical protein
MRGNGLIELHCFENANFLRGENSRSGFNWLCIATSLFKTYCFESTDSRCCLDSGLCCTYKVLITLPSSFVFLLLPFVVDLCAYVMYLRHFVVAEVRCKYLQIYIYIYIVLFKKIHHHHSSQDPSMRQC